MVSRRHRPTIDVPESLLKRVQEKAGRRGDVLSDVVHSALISAAKAAEAGRVELLPARLSRTAAHAETNKGLRFTASTEQCARIAAALSAAGSSMRVVAIRCLEAFDEADGVWLDTVMPGEPGWRDPDAGAA